jgi:hypothetical protein
LCRYGIELTDDDLAEARTLLETCEGRSAKAEVSGTSAFGVRTSHFALLHYQGVSARQHKDLPEASARRAIETCAAAGLRVLLVDFDNRSGLRRHPAVTLLPRPRDAMAFAAVARLCRLTIGIDSGPAKLAQAAGCRTIVAWTGMHPLHYDAPMPNALHLVPADHERRLKVPWTPAARDYFHAQYRHRVYQGLGEALHDSVHEELRRA